MQLPRWRDDPKRPHEDSEKLLNSTLVDFLDAQARTHFPMARFKHEAPQSPKRTVDIGVHAIRDVLIEATSYSIYDPFLVIEAKRLPATKGNGRETEYVSGFVSKNDSATGGIQRFKLGAHGNGVHVAAIVGFVQQGSASEWHGTINTWIRDLATNPPKDHCEWTKSDCLQEQTISFADRTSSCRSKHSRTTKAVSTEICLHHLWVAMTNDGDW